MYELLLFTPPSLADKVVDDAGAALALDIAAPVEFAVAALHQLRLVLVIAAAAAHELAAVRAFRRLVAEAAHGSRRACALVPQAVIWAGIQVNQVSGTGRAEAPAQRHQLATAIEPHGSGTIVALLECIADPPEVGQLQPACLQAAGARHPVTLAGHVSQV